MANHEQISTSEVQRVEKQGDKNDWFKMAWRLDEVLPGEYSLIERSAWSNYWFEKAANAGHVRAISQIAHMYYKMSYDGAAVKYRQMAMKYYQELSDLLDDEKLDEDDRDLGMIAKMWLGILFCMGTGIPRDVKKGKKLIEEAERLTTNFEGYGFIPLKELGEMYGQGYAQPDEVPTSGDLKKAIEYLEASIQPFQIEHLIQEVGQDIGQRLIEDVKKYLEIMKRHFRGKVEEEKNFADLFDSVMQQKKRKEEGLENIYDLSKEGYEILQEEAAIQNRERINNRRKKMMELSDETKHHMKAYENALKKLTKNIDLYNVECLKGKAIELQALGKKEETIECYDKVLNIDPNNIDCLKGKAELLKGLGKKEEVIDCYDKILNIDPNNIDCLKGKVVVLEESGRKKEALVYCKKILKLVPNDSYAIYAKHRLQKGCGRWVLVIGVLLFAASVFSPLLINWMGYKEIIVFSEGMAAIRRGKLWGYKDESGKKVIPYSYSYAGSFSEGLAAVKIGDAVDDKWGFIDKEGNEVIPFKYNSAHKFSEGLAAVKSNDKWGFIDKSGKEIISFRYDAVVSYSRGFVKANGEFSEGLVAVSRNGKWGFINKSGNEIIPLKYDEVEPFSSDGYARVGISANTGVESWKYHLGVIDKRGNIIVPLKYHRIGDFKGDLAIVYISANQTRTYENGLKRTYESTTSGVVNKNGQEIIAPNYYSVRILDEMIEITTGGKSTDKKQYFDKSGNRINR